MALTVTHRFVSAKADSSDPTLVNPSNWNATHIISGGSPLSAPDYDFTPIAPGGSLTASITNSITLPVVPLGVNGTDIGHYLYINSGTGTAEVVLITGGTAVAGGTNQTLTFVPANNHSGAWVIQSATAGAAEASQSLIAVGGGAVYFPGGSFNFYGPFIAPTTVPLTVQGTGSGSNLIINQTTGTVFTFTGAGVDYTIKDLQIKTAGGTPRNLIAISTGATSTFTVSGLRLSGFHIYFNLFGPTNLVYIAGNFLNNPFTGGIGVQFATDGTSPGNAVITGNTMTCVAPGDFLAGIYFAGTAISSGIWVSYNNIFQPSYGLYISPTSGGEVSQLFSTGNAYQATALNGIIAAPSGSGFVRVFVSIGDNIEVGSGSGMAFGGFGGTIDGINISNAKVNLNVGTGIWLRSGTSNSVISNCTVAQNSRTSSGTFPGLLVDAGVSKWQVNGGIYGPADGSPSNLNTQSYGIQVAAGASDNYSIVGTYIPANATGSISDSGTGVNKVINSNLGVDNAAPPVVASATTIALDTTDQPVINITGTTTVTGITGGWKGRTITLYKTDAGSATVMGYVLAQNKSLRLTSPDGTNWY